MVLGILLGIGVLNFDFSIHFLQVFLTFLAGLACQYLWIKRLKLSSNSFFSALITCLSIALLLRSSNFWVHPLCAVLAISSKFIIQKEHKHFFNPSAFGIVLMLLLPGVAWLSPGQWGSFFLIAAWIVVFGSFITTKVYRVDISWFFLIFYLGGLLLRNTWLGYEWAIFQHSMLNGSLLVFAFFMISDPKTSPNHLFGKVIQAFFVAIVSLFIHYYLYKQNGFIYALVLSSLLVPVLNKFLPAQSFEWRKS